MLLKSTLKQSAVVRRELNREARNNNSRLSNLWQFFSKAIPRSEIGVVF